MALLRAPTWQPVRPTRGFGYYGQVRCLFARLRTLGNRHLRNYDWAQCLCEPTTRSVARHRAQRTVDKMGANRIHDAVLVSPWTASWLARARPGDLYDPSFARRTGAWAQWAAERLEVVSGLSERRYPALVLPGVFFQSSPASRVRPHIEIPRRVLDGADPGFPTRLAAAGNGLLFPSWLPEEVIAIKRALFGGGASDPSDIVALLAAARGPLTSRLSSLSATLARQWSTIEAALVSDPGPVSAKITAGFTGDEVSSVLPSLAGYTTRITFDTRLAEAAGPRAARRVGVWVLSASDGTDETRTAAVTPRLTRSSLFTDPLFLPPTEAPAALLVRVLLLSRLLELPHTSVGLPAAPARGFRLMPAAAGKALPEASEEAAAVFVQTFDNAAAAWTALTTWAASRPERLVLTVSQAGFEASYATVARAVRRAVPPSRDDINVILPVGWSGGKRVVRVTFSRTHPQS